MSLLYVLRQLRKCTPRQIHGLLQLRKGITHHAQNTTATLLCCSYNTSSLGPNVSLAIRIIQKFPFLRLYFLPPSPFPPPTRLYKKRGDGVRNTCTVSPHLQHCAEQALNDSASTFINYIEALKPQLIQKVGQQRILEYLMIFDTLYTSTIYIQTLYVQRRYSQSQSPGSPIQDFIKDDSFVLISCQSGPSNLNEQIYSVIGSVESRLKSSPNSVRLSSLPQSVHEFHKCPAKNPGLLYLDHIISIISSL